MNNLDCFSGTITIVAAHVGNNSVSTEQLPGLIRNVFRTLNSVHPEPNVANAPLTEAGLSERSPFDTAPTHPHAHVEPVSEPAENEQRPTRNPAVDPKKSVFPDYIICLEDGARLKTLKRHLSASFNMTPEQYRARWNLPLDYPMVAPNYAKTRSEMARNIGLGRKGRGKPPVVHPNEPAPRNAPAGDKLPITRFAEGVSSRKTQRRHAA